MEGILLGLDVFFMIVLTLGVVRLRTGKNKSCGLGFFGFSEKRVGLRDDSRGETSA